MPTELEKATKNWRDILYRNVEWGGIDGKTKPVDSHDPQAAEKTAAINAQVDALAAGYTGMNKKTGVEGMAGDLMLIPLTGKATSYDKGNPIYKKVHGYLEHCIPNQGKGYFMGIASISTEMLNSMAGAEDNRRGTSEAAMDYAAEHLPPVNTAQPVSNLPPTLHGPKKQR